MPHWKSPMKNISYCLATLLFLTSCGIYKVPMIVSGQEYKKKTFSFSCGEMTVDPLGMRGDYRLDLTIDPNPEIFIYRDSLSVTYHSEKIGYGFSGDQKRISSRTDLMLFIDIWRPFDLPTEDNFVRIKFDGVFYCGNQKASLEEILIDRFR